MTQAQSVSSVTTTTPYVARGFDQRGLLTGDPWDQIEDEVLALATRPDDWDGEGAARASAASVQGALRFCRVARARAVPRCVSMTRDGALLMEWHAASEYQELEFVDEHHAELMIAPHERDATHRVVYF